MIVSGIYTIINKQNGKQYIGSSNTIFQRWREHKSDLRRNKHTGVALQNTWNKYGEENFEFKILEVVEDRNKLIEREQYYLDLHKTYKPENGYNISKKADRCVHSEESKRLISQSNLGRKMSPEFCRKQSERMKGNKNLLGFKFSEQSKQLLSQRRLGKHPSQRARLNMTITQQRLSLTRKFLRISGVN